MKKWESLSDVPLSAWFRFKTQPNHIFKIQQIDLQYAGAPMPGLALRASPQVMICGKYWRPSELSDAFECSLDCEHWQQCTGEIAGGDVDKLAAHVSKSLAQSGTLHNELQAALAKQLEVAKSQEAKMQEIDQAIKSIQDSQAKLMKQKP